jgi:hypothetical protein
MGKAGGYFENKPNTKRSFAPQPGPPIKPTAPTNPTTKSSADAHLYGPLGVIARDASKRTDVHPSAANLTALVLAGAFVGRASYVRWADARLYPLVSAVLVTEEGHRPICQLVLRVFEAAAGALSTGIPQVAFWPGSIQYTSDPLPVVLAGNFDRTIWDSRRGARILVHASHSWDGVDTSTLYKPKRMLPPVALLGNAALVDLVHISPTAFGITSRCLWHAAPVRQMDVHEPRSLSDEQVQHYAEPIVAAIKHARSVGELGFGNGIDWVTRGADFVKSNGSLTSPFLQFGFAHVIRLATLFAVFDCSDKVENHHLDAAVSLWKDSCQSVERIFGARPSDAISQRLLALVEQERSKSELHALFSNHASADVLSSLLMNLERAGLVIRKLVTTGGRPREVWLRRKDDVTSSDIASS